MSNSWRQYICRACGLVYDEELGDPDSGLAPGTRFEDIPDDWECPLCGVTKSDFEPYEQPVAAAAADGDLTVAIPANDPGIVIVGAGTAGWATAEAIRALDAEVPITIVTACNGDIYHKPELSVALARGATPASLRRQAGSERALRLGVRLIRQTFAVAIDAPRRRLHTTRGPVAYDRLVIAQGARPAIPAPFTPDLCWRINTLDAWAALHAHVADGSRRIAIVGAGMIGCELAEDFARAGHDVTILDIAHRPLGALLPEVAADRLADGLAGLGIRFLGRARVAAADRQADGIHIALADASTIMADIVVVAAGLATDHRLARSAGLACDRGIAVDPASLETSVPGIHALGDCISIDGEPCRFIEPIAGQARAIAHAVLGRDHDGYRHRMPVIRLKTKSAPIVLHGRPNPRATWRTTEDGGRLVMEQWLGDDCVARLTA